MVYLLFSCFAKIPKMMYIGKYALCGVCVNQFGSSFLCSYATWVGLYSTVYVEHAIPI